MPSSSATADSKSLIVGSWVVIVWVSVVVHRTVVRLKPDTTTTQPPSIVVSGFSRTIRLPGRRLL